MSVAMFVRLFQAAFLLLALQLLGLTALPARIVADFTAGETKDSVDGWEGMAGEGWTVPWSGASNGSASWEAAVRTENPLFQGNYLSVTMTNNHASSRQNVVVSRTYSDYGKVSRKGEHSVSFYYRLDSPIDQFNRITLFNDSSRRLGVDTSSEQNWSLRSDLNTQGWRVSTLNSEGVAVYWSTYVHLFQGDVYFFQLNLNPEEGKYTVQITNLDYEANGRTAGEATYENTLWLQGDTTEINSVLNFAHQINSGAQDVSFSLDGLHIIPEPGVFVLGTAKVALLMIVLRRMKMVGKR